MLSNRITSVFGKYGYIRADIRPAHCFSSSPSTDRHTTQSRGIYGGVGRRVAVSGAAPAADTRRGRRGLPAEEAAGSDREVGEACSSGGGPREGLLGPADLAAAPPAASKIEDDGNHRFVIFVRTAIVYFWYPFNIVTGGTTAKIMLAAKNNFLGKYIYEDTLARNLAAVIYKDEDDIIDTAKEQYRVLRTENEFRYGYKVVENGNLRAARQVGNLGRSR